MDADPTRLAQVIANLLNNGAKYTPEGGHIEVTVEAGAGEAVLRVRDDGAGMGSEFVVRLPAMAAPAATAEPAPQSQMGDLNSRRVLVVDDNVDGAHSLAMLLGAWGHEVRTAYDGPVALRAAEAFRPQVVLLDIGLPRMDGYEVARRMRGQAARHARLVALTGYGQEEDRRRAREAGFDAHLTKPADPATLHALVAGR